MDLYGRGVVARVTADAVNGETLDSELARDTTSSGTPSTGRRTSRHSDDPGLGSVEGEIAVTDSPKTLFGEAEYVDLECTVTRIPVTTEPKRLVNGPYWNLDCFNPCSFAVAK